jgi:hypothetical protein
MAAHCLQVVADIIGVLAVAANTLQLRQTIVYYA